MVKSLTYAFSNPPDTNDVITTVSVKVRFMCSVIVLFVTVGVSFEHQGVAAGSMRNLARKFTCSVVAWTLSPGRRALFSEINC